MKSGKLVELPKNYRKFLPPCSTTNRKSAILDCISDINPILSVCSWSFDRLAWKFVNFLLRHGGSKVIKILTFFVPIEETWPGVRLWLPKNKSCYNSYRDSERDETCWSLTRQNGQMLTSSNLPHYNRKFNVLLWKVHIWLPFHCEHETVTRDRKLVGLTCFSLLSFLQTESRLMLVIDYILETFWSVILVQ